jgi:tetratricopeptide (TPR) repeat protein
MIDDGRLVAQPAQCGDAASPAAQALWKRLERLAYPEQIEAIEADRRFHSAALCRRLQIMSLMASPANPEVGSQFANLAVRISWHLEPGPGDRPGAEHDLQALAHGYLGAARRALGELEGAGDAFDMARTLRARGTGAPGVEAEIAWFEVWVCLDQDRFAAAIGLLDRMLAADAAASAAEPGSLRSAAVAPALVAKAWCCYHLGGVEAAEVLLDKAQRLDLSDLPELDLASRFGRLWCAITRGSPEAEDRLGDAAALAQKKEGTEAALAWLALAKLRLEVGGSAARGRVERIATKLVRAFLPEAARVQLLQLFLFMNACTRGKVTVAEVTALARVIEGTRQPGLTWWAEWGPLLKEERGHDAPPLAAG